MTTDDVKKFYGTTAEALRVLGQTYAHWGHWKKLGIPCKRQAEIQRVTKGILKAGDKVPCKEYRT